MARVERKKKAQKNEQNGEKMRSSGIIRDRKLGEDEEEQLTKEEAGKKIKCQKVE